MRRFVSAGLVLVVGILSAGPADGRTWTSRSGTFTVEAELVDVRDGNVVLKRQDESLLTVPLNKLSLADVRYVKEALDKAEQSVTGKTDEDRGIGKAAAGTGQTKTARPASVPAKDVGPPLARSGVGGWQAQPDPPGVAFTLPADAKIEIRVPSGFGPRVFYPSAPCPFVLFTGGPGRDNYEVWDLRTGTQAGRITEAARSTQAFALSPCGTRLVTAELGRDGGLKVWSFKTGAMERKLALEGMSFVQYVEFAGPNRIVAPVSTKNAIMIWDVATGEVETQIPSQLTPDKQGLAVSPGGHYLAVMPPTKGLRIYDLRSGVAAGDLAVVPRQGSSYVHPEAFAFSPDGKELAGLFRAGSGTSLMAWDMTTGKLAVEHYFPKSPHSLVEHASQYQGRPLEWFADRTAWLLYGAAVVDRQKGGPVWTEKLADGAFDRPARRIVDADRMIVVEGPRDSEVLRLVKIPKTQIAASAEVVQKGGTADDANLPPLTKADWSAVMNLGYPSQATWSFRPDGTAKAEATQMARVQLQSRIAEVKRVLFSSAASGKALAAVSGRLPAELGTLGRERRSFDCYDLRSGKMEKRLDLPFAADAIDFSADGKLGVFCNSGSKSRVDVWSLADSKHLIALRPYLGSESYEEDVAYAAAVDASHLITCNQRGRLVCWAMPAGKAVYETQIQFLGKPVLSPGRQALLVRDAGGFRLIEPVSGKDMGVLADPACAAGAVMAHAAFRSDGRQLAALYSIPNGTLVANWDLTSGKLLRQAWLPLESWRFHWCGPQQLAVLRMERISSRRTSTPKEDEAADLANVLVIDLEKEAVVWQYKVGPQYQMDGGPDDRFWYLASAEILQPVHLVGLALPDADAATAVAAAAPLKPILSPGAELALSIDLALAADHKDAAELRSSLDERFRSLAAQNQWKVVEKAPTILKVELKERIGPEEREIHLFPSIRRPFGGGATLVVHPLEVRCGVAVVDGGTKKTLWSVTSAFSADRLERTSPGFVPEREIPASFRVGPWTHAIAWTKAAHVPAKLFPAAAYEGFGRSSLTPTGPVRIQLLRAP